MKLYIFGRQGGIAAAELENLVGAENLTRLGNIAALVENIEPQQSELGGSTKTCDVIKVLAGNSKDALSYLAGNTSLLLKNAKLDRKIKLGVSVYGENISNKALHAMSLSLKNSIRKSGFSVRLMDNKTPQLSAAQILYNKLTHENGIDLTIVSHGGKSYIAQTIAVQDIDDYTVRDRGRPKRDARIGMLPPKLAQIIINLSYSGSKQTLLDPFCGTGVILQEALLKGYEVYGTDINNRMIDYSRDNLNWLQKKYPVKNSWQLHEGDATNTSWQQPIDSVACETYLGRPFTSMPENELLEKNRADCDTIIRKFLENIHPQLKSGTRLCLGVPAWFAKNRTYHLKTLDYLEEIGYNRISFVHAKNNELIYHREGQIVGRELLVLTRR
jgi:tRNA (guanine10-N2)-dimethyltransferase